METIVAGVQWPRGPLALRAVVSAAYAGYELATDPDWRRSLTGTIARLWLLVVLAVVGIAYLVFDADALLLLSYRSGLPLHALQMGFLVSLAAATLVWTRG